MTHTLCPERPRMNVLVHGPLPEDEERRLADHLDHCPDCQERAEELTGLGTWNGHHLTRTAPQLRRVIDAMKNKDQLTAPGMGSLPLDDSMLLSFLQPAPSEDCLGLLNDYEVTEVLGRGGMGVVLKAFDPSLERYVAIKVLAPQLATSPSARERFAREARAAAAINHEHVVAIHDVDTVDGLPYLVMEYVAGLSLQELLERDGPLPLAEILRIGAKVASGLAAAHAQGLVHRDIKPANILLSPEVQSPKSKVQSPDIDDQEPWTLDLGPWTPKISDFGLARTADDASLTQSGMLAGTPHYMAPEQARGEALDARADLFSLGSVLYALCTGEPPFPDGSTLAVLRQVSETRPPSVRRLNPTLPYWFDELIARLHAPNPDDRFASAAEVTELLQRCLAHVQQPDGVPLPAELTVSCSRRRFLRRWAIPALALAGLLGILAAVANGLPGHGQVQQRNACAPPLPVASDPSSTEDLSWVTVDREQHVQVAGRHVKVKGPTGTVKGSGSALELNLKLPGAQRARILIFGLPGDTVDDGPCASQAMPSVSLPEPRTPPCAAQSSRSTATSDQVRKDAVNEPLLCLVFADVGCAASTVPGFASLIYWQPHYTPVVIKAPTSKERIARRSVKSPEPALLNRPVEG